MFNGVQLMYAKIVLMICIEKQTPLIENEDDPSAINGNVKVKWDSSKCFEYKNNIDVHYIHDVLMELDNVKVNSTLKKKVILVVISPQLLFNSVCCFGGIGSNFDDHMYSSPLPCCFYGYM